MSDIAVPRAVAPARGRRRRPLTRDQWADLYDRTSSRAYGLCLRMLGDAAEAEEVVEVAYAEAWRTAPRRSRLGAEAWILAVVHRHAAAARRSRAAVERPAADGTADPEVLALELAYFEGLGVDEIAMVLGTSADVVRRHLRDGLLRHQR